MNFKVLAFTRAMSRVINVAKSNEVFSIMNTRDGVVSTSHKAITFPPLLNGLGKIWARVYVKC